MYKFLAINLGNTGSTGKIVRLIAKRTSNYESYFAYPSRIENNEKQSNEFYICSKFSFKMSRKLGQITGWLDCFSYFSTKKLISKIKHLNPDFIHLHNLHGGYINLKLLFNYFKKSNIPIVWTLHDCWPFTGRCPYFTAIGCDFWKTGCNCCPYPKKEYPFSNVDKAKKLWKLKRDTFSGIKKMQIVTPSKWLAELVKQSFLRDYDITVINNGIDLDVFKPTESGLLNKIKRRKYLILGVAFDWGYRKGLDVFIELSKTLPDCFQIVLVGTNTKIDEALPENITSIHRTQNQAELAQIYSLADLFVNPTREDNYPTVNMEALACGTPVLTFDTGGSTEIIDETCGSSVKCNDFDALTKEIIRICENKPFTKEACIEKAKSFSNDVSVAKYSNLYEALLK